MPIAPHGRPIAEPDSRSHSRTMLEKEKEKEKEKELPNSPSTPPSRELTREAADGPAAGNAPVEAASVDGWESRFPTHDQAKYLADDHRAHFGDDVITHHSDDYGSYLACQDCDWSIAYVPDDDDEPVSDPSVVAAVGDLSDLFAMGREAAAEGLESRGPDVGLGGLDEAALDQIEQRANAATSGPWIVADGAEPHDAPVLTPSGHPLCISPDDGVRGGHDLWDAEFIAAARTDVPALVAEVRALRARLGDQDDEVERLRGLATERDAQLRYAVEAWPVGLGDQPAEIRGVGDPSAVELLTEIFTGGDQPAQAETEWAGEWTVVYAGDCSSEAESLEDARRIASGWKNPSIMHRQVTPWVRVDQEDSND